MTCIAYRNGVLAAGNASTTLGIYRPSKKVDSFYSVRLGMKVMLALTGYVVFLERAKEALREGTEWPDITRYDRDADLTHQIGIVVTEHKTVHHLYADGGLGPALPFDGWLCDGSGYSFLAGALAAGAGAVQAVELANEHTDNDALGVSFLTWSEVFEPEIDGGIPF